MDFFNFSIPYCVLCVHQCLFQPLWFVLGAKNKHVDFAQDSSICDVLCLHLYCMWLEYPPYPFKCTFSFIFWTRSIPPSLLPLFSISCVPHRAGLRHGLLFLPATTSPPNNYITQQYQDRAGTLTIVNSGKLLQQLHVKSKPKLVKKKQSIKIFTYLYRYWFTRTRLKMNHKYDYWKALCWLTPCIITF